MSFQMYNGALSANIDRTPLTLNEATRTLYDRAIADPSSLTDAERRTITHRPPEEEENALCQKACGQSMSELVSRAVQNGDSLSYNEAHLLTAGVIPNQAGRLLSEQARLSAADRDLTHRAMEAAMTEQMKTARASAQAVQKRWNLARTAAFESLNSDDVRNIQYSFRVPWQEHILAIPGTTACGLVVFFPAVPGWVSFKEQIETAIYHGLHYSPQQMKEAALARFTLHWVEGDHADACQDQFVSMRDRGKFPPGLRSDSFLYVDQEALQSHDHPRPFVWLWEPEDTKEPPLKVHVKHIAPTLFARLTQRDLSTEEARRRPYRHTSELAMLHQAASHSRTATGDPDMIWPPPARYM
ncbi:hypothetical protein EYZ11_013039 [Aspergillus tanneri]|uniref:Uncharacterized protein n=1 Tax=Aspergillus tanneri TaxID=1220188 RepID=A0A4S3IYN8_9EURO|nr:uncharacterized protein ATNIH1004_001639 [Aspergillus tanneri]KAA8652734.1 hypothetical protein ATNIH1004_001639 [Aspergillus tanneri]THC87516.1 hypothetical protein EYZ11_013039 [Aspergillus tanneri]